MSGTSGNNPENGITGLTTQEMEALINELKKEKSALKTELRSSRQESEDRLAEKDELIRNFKDEQKHFLMDIQKLRRELQISRDSDRKNENIITNLNRRVNYLTTQRRRLLDEFTSTKENFLCQLRNLWGMVDYESSNRSNQAGGPPTTSNSRSSKTLTSNYF